MHGWGAGGRALPTYNPSVHWRRLAVGIADRVGIGDRLRALSQRAREKCPDRAALDERAMRIVIASALSPDGNAIDVGSNRGQVLEHISRVAPSGKHVAFEPLPALARGLMTRFPSVDVRVAAASNRSGVGEFVHVVSRDTFSGLRQRQYDSAEELQQIQVTLERIDDVVPSAIPIHLVKVDVEGAELEVLEGALVTLARWRPAVIFEHGLGGAPFYGTTPDRLFRLLREVELRVFDLDGDGPYSEQQFVESFHVGKRWNYLASA